MKRLGVLALLFTASALAQTSNVTATITDPDGQTWNNGTYTITFIPTPGIPGPYTWSGGNPFPNIYTGSFTSIGVLAIALPDNNFISPKGSKWQFTLCSQTSAPCQNVTTTVTGATPDLSTTLSSTLIAPRFGPGQFSFGYIDAEVAGALLPGVTYFNVTNTIQRIWNGSVWVNNSNGGTGLVSNCGAVGPLYYSSVIGQIATCDLFATTDGSGNLTFKKLTIGSGTGIIDMTEGASPGNPASGKGRQYVDSTTHLFTCLDPLAPSSNCIPSPITGTPTNGDCAKFASISKIQDAGYPCVTPSTVPTQVIQNGLLAEYRFTDGSGLTAADSSGNGNTATLGTGGNAPSWLTAGGLQFAASSGQFVTLPSALNTSITMQFVVQFQYAGAPQFNALIASASGASTDCGILMLDNQHNNVNQGTNYAFEMWTNGSYGAGWRQTVQGTAIVSHERPTSGSQLLQLNYDTLRTASTGTTFDGANYQLGGIAAGTGGTACPSGANTYFNGQILYAVFYNRALTQTEININNQFLTSVMFSRGTPINTQSTSLTDILLLDGDSEITFETNSMMSFPPTPVNVYNIGASGYFIEQMVADGPTVPDTYVQTAATRQADLIWGGTNNLTSSGLGCTGANAQCVMNFAASYCRARRLKGFKCIVVDLMDHNAGGGSAFKNGVNVAERTSWSGFADAFVDIGADPLMGCDGCATSSTYFQTGLHPSLASANNIVAPYIQRSINRLYGNNDWTSAATYASAAPAATAITAASESGNTVTITSTLNPPVNSCVTVAGVTPSGYNNVSGECWNVLTTSGSNFTYYNWTTGLGAGSVFGTASVPLQKDADTYTILNFGAGSFTLEPCGGYTGGKLYIKNINAGSSTVTAWGNDLIDGSTTATIAQNAVLVLQDKVVTSAAPVCSWVKVQNN
jgi:hypothetical protein